MRHLTIPRRARLLLLVAALPVLAGCVELTGQRFTLRHDAENDRLVLLIAHDGIHEADTNNKRKGANQIPDYIRNGDVMLFDWFAELRRQTIRDALENDEVGPAARDLLSTYVDTVRTEPLGHYRDPQGRIGAYQKVVVPGASAFIRKVNAAIAEEILAAANDEPKTSSALALAMVPEARAGRQWLRLEGQSLILSLPFLPREWAMKRADVLKDLCERFADADEEGREKFDPTFFVQLLGSDAVFMVEGPDRLELRFGSVAEPHTLRGVLRERYDERLEPVVVKHVPEEADALITASLLGSPETLPENWRDVIAMLPPEDRVRAIVGALAAPDQRDAAVRWLTEFSAAWSTNERVPAPPEDPTDTAGWATWYKAMLRFPLR